MKRITQQKLAEMAGVSVSTVSKAFSGSTEISKQTRENIFSLAKQYGCFDRFSNVCYEKKVIAVIAPEFVSNVYTRGINIIDKLIRDRGYVMLLSFYNFSGTGLTELIRYFSNYVKVDGIIVLSGNSPFPHTTIPIVSFGDSGKPIPFVDTFSSECKSTVIEAIKHLKDNGHKNIAFIGELLTSTKLDYFKYAMKENGLSANSDLIKVSHLRFEQAGFSEAEKILSLPVRPTAIMCAYDAIAFGAIDAIKRRGFKIPEDFSIIGMNDVKQSEYSGIELTSIREMPDETFSMMFELLCKRIEGSTIPHQSIALRGELIKRGSVCSVIQKKS